MREGVQRGHTASRRLGDSEDSVNPGASGEGICVCRFAYSIFSVHLLGLARDAGHIYEYPAHIEGIS